MNKLRMIACIAILFCVTLSIGYFLSGKTPPTEWATDQQARQILTDGGCVSCHSENPKLPFYASWPIAKNLVKQDIKKGLEQFDALPLLDALQKQGTVPEVDLAKLEQVARTGSMPPPQYYLVHWGSSLNSAKKEMLVHWATEQRIKHYAEKETAEQWKSAMNQPITASYAINNEKAHLGKILFHDTRLSSDNTISCASCHGLNTGGVDNKQYSEGVDGQLGGVNAPTVYNAVFNLAQFWDGRAADLAQQAAGPPLNPIEMASKSFDEIIAKLSEDLEFTQLFTTIYPNGYTEASITEAIAEFEKTLVTPNSRFDQYLKGNSKALNETELEGYQLFKENKCATCHVGKNMGGQSYERLAQAEKYFEDRGTPLNEDDKGRYKVSRKENDLYRYKVPSLRNIALTAPYFHDGTQKTLDEAVDGMMKYHLGKELSDQKKEAIVAFLHTLTGEYEGKLLSNNNQ